MNYLLVVFAQPLWFRLKSSGLGLPVVKQAEPDAVDSVRTHRVRTKRCSCSELLDTECHYFCHLDIIWVNTPRWATEDTFNRYSRVFFKSRLPKTHNNAWTTWIKYQNSLVLPTLSLETSDWPSYHYCRTIKQGSCKVTANKVCRMFMWLRLSFNPQ